MQIRIYYGLEFWTKFVDLDLDRVRQCRGWSTVQMDRCWPAAKVRRKLHAVVYEKSVVS